MILARRLWPLVSALTLAALLVGCATPLPDNSAPVAAGRLLVRVDSQPPRSLSGEFELRGNPQTGSLRLIGPLGSIAADARWSPQVSSLFTPTGRSDFANLDELSQAALGESVPVAALFAWLRGRPWDQAQSQALADGAPGFMQLGWQVRLARFAEGWVEAERDALPRVMVRAKLESLL